MIWRLYLLTALCLTSSSLLRAQAEEGGTNRLSFQGVSGAQSGRELAQIYCSACHLFPEPNLLDKQTWLNGALRRMAPLLGVGKINLEKNPDRALLEAAGIFPKTPLISEAHWRAISEFYRDQSPSEPLPQDARPQIKMGLSNFVAHPLTYPGASARITMIKIDPLAGRIYVGNGEANALDILSGRGELIGRVPVESPPASLTVRPEGLYVTLIGRVLPSDEHAGKLVLLTPKGTQFETKILLNDLPRPVQATLADLNRDGQEDILLSCFGNYLGKFAWFQNLGEGRYKENVLLERPGAIDSVVLNRKDGPPEIIVLMAQAREGVFQFTREPKGTFQTKALAEFHPVFGSTHLEVVDLNGDGAPDLLVSNGDNGEYASPLKKYHGVRILLNDGKDNFHEAFFFPLNGAFKAVAADFDGDGDLDIAAISYFPDYKKSPEESFVFLENKGDLHFEPFSFPGCTAGRWLTMDYGDVDGDGDADLVLGAFAEGPRSIPIPPELRLQWLTNPPLLLLENASRKSPPAEREPQR